MVFSWFVLEGILFGFIADELYSRSFTADGWLISSRQWWYYCLETVKFLELQEDAQKAGSGFLTGEHSDPYIAGRSSHKENDASSRNILELIAEVLTAGD